MSMSTRVVGFKPTDDKWEKMKRVYNACVESGVEIPNGVNEFFDYQNPNELLGIEVDISSAIIKNRNTGGADVDVRKLPKDVHIIKFENSW